MRRGSERKGAGLLSSRDISCALTGIIRRGRGDPKFSCQEGWRYRAWCCVHWALSLDVPGFIRQGRGKGCRIGRGTDPEFSCREGRR